MTTDKTARTTVPTAIVRAKTCVLVRGLYQFGRRERWLWIGGSFGTPKWSTRESILGYSLESWNAPERARGVMFRWFVASRIQKNLSDQMSWPWCTLQGRYHKGRKWEELRQKKKAAKLPTFSVLVDKKGFLGSQHDSKWSESYLADLEFHLVRETFFVACVFLISLS